MIRVAAVGDVHYDAASRNRLRSYFDALGGRADLLLVAGDLTQRGSPDEAAALADDLRGLPVPVVAVLGNHDYHGGREGEIRDILEDAGIVALEGNATVLELTLAGQPRSVGIMGIKGFGGGFGPQCLAAFGEPEMKAFAQHARRQAEILKAGLLELQTDFRFALLHYAPIDGTLLGEKREIYPFLGNYLLAEAVDEAGADAVFHGHAHYGIERGNTPGGVPVRNVAQMVIRHAYHVYSFEPSRRWRQMLDVSAAAYERR